MATVKKDLADPQVQGNWITFSELQRRLGCSSADARRFLDENDVHFIRAGNRMLIDGDEVDRDMESRRSASAADGPPVRSAATELVRRSRAKQGLPPKIEDAEVYGRIVALLGSITPFG